jgi:heme oxygenase
VSATALTPTGEQAAIVAAARAGRDLVVEAGAGTGKTSTLKLVAQASPHWRGVYVAYNRAIAADAKRAFPPSVTCATAHALAFRAVGRRYAHRLNAPRVPARQTARLLAITRPIRLDRDRVLAPEQTARVVMETITRFCYSAAPEPGPGHVPGNLPGLDDPAACGVLRRVVVPLARRAWDDLSSPDGRLRFTHDCYLKLWQLSDPRLACDYVLFDEAQDANPVVAAIVDRQQHAQRILVGDSCQAIYGWRGAVDALARFPADQRLVLSQSFRFGPAIAAEANRWLALLDAPLRLRGSTTLRSRVGPLPRADAVLCRTNAEAVRQVLLGVDQARRVALVGGGEQLRRLAQAAISLKAGRGTDHPELFAFTTWTEVQDYAANDHAGADLKVLVDLVDGHGPEQLVYLVDQLVPEQDADLVVSTAHKAKGREWPTVRLAGDFGQPDQHGDGRPPEVVRPEAMLAYVAVTRARQALDPAGLAPANQQPPNWPGRWWA